MIFCLKGALLSFGVLSFCSASDGCARVGVVVMGNDRKANNLSLSLVLGVSNVITRTLVF
jgi:hypothetical protein